MASTHTLPTVLRAATAQGGDPTAHRALVVTDPPMHGRDVANLQRATFDRLKARGLADDVPVAFHGKFTLATALACLEAQYFLGLRSDTYMARDPHGNRMVTVGAQRLIRRPELREADQLARAKARAARLAAGPRFYEQLAMQLGLTGGHGPDDAVKFAEAQVGVKESPANSNSGPKIDDWESAAGYDGPVPWCGCFVNACLMAGGLPSGAPWSIGSVMAVRKHALDGIDGWKFVSAAEGGVKGDLALYDEPGGDLVDHVEIVRAKLSDTTYSAIGGNTSSGDGSQSDGGCVARHDNRSTTDSSFRIVGFARPPWK